MVESCGCRVDVRVIEDDEGFTTTSSIRYCPKHYAADDVLAALEDVLTVQPRPVKIPGTAMDLTVSYTEGDLLKMEVARAVAAKARGDAPRSDAHGDLSGLGDDDCRQYVLKEEENR